MRNLIKEMLVERDKSIYWLAGEVSMSYQAIHKLATSPSIPDGTSYGTLKRISEVLGVGIESLEAEQEPAKVEA